MGYLRAYILYISRPRGRLKELRKIPFFLPSPSLAAPHPAPRLPSGAAPRRVDGTDHADFGGFMEVGGEEEGGRFNQSVGGLLDSPLFLVSILIPGVLGWG